MVPRKEEGTPKRREHIVVVTGSSCRDPDRQQPSAVDGCCWPAVTDLRGGGESHTDRNGCPPFGYEERKSHRAVIV